MKKILIIEDDKSLQKELYTLLINSGYEAEIVTVFEKEEQLRDYWNRCRSCASGY